MQTTSKASSVRNALLAGRRSGAGRPSLLLQQRPLRPRPVARACSPVAKLAQGRVDLSFQALQAKGTSTRDISFAPATFTAHYTIIQDPAAARADLPILFFLPAWNVEVERYSRLTGRLTSAGYTLVTATTPQTFPFPVEGMPYPGCPAEQLVPSAATLSHFSLNRRLFDPHLGVKAGRDPEVVVVGAGTAGWSALLSATGQCCDMRRLRDPEAISYCNGWQGFQGAIRGAVVYETMTNTVGEGFELPPDMFCLWLAGEWDVYDGTHEAFQASTGSRTSAYVQLGQLNAYGWVDYMPDSPTGQRPRCAYCHPDERDFFPTREQQEEGIDLSATLADAAIRAALLGDADACKLLAGIGDHPRVLRALGTQAFARAPQKV